ncbi:MAG: hypothetical protein RI897_3952 [Verrucomicrobiota bacterium]
MGLVGLSGVLLVEGFVLVERMERLGSWTDWSGGVESESRLICRRQSAASVAAVSLRRREMRSGIAGVLLGPLSGVEDEQREAGFEHIGLARVGVDLDGVDEDGEAEEFELGDPLEEVGGGAEGFEAHGGEFFGGGAAAGFAEGANLDAGGHG